MKLPLTIPFCRSMTINAALGSRVVSGIEFSSSNTSWISVKAGHNGLILNKPRKQFECRLKLLPLVSGKFLRNRCGEPVLSCGPALLKQLQAFGRERHQSLPPVARVRCTTDHAGFMHRRQHRSEEH